MPPPSEIDPLAQRKYRAHWRVESGILTQGIQPLRYRQGRTTQQHYNYPEFYTRHIRNDSSALRYPWRPRACIYCGASVYSSTRKALGEEHIIPEGTGGTLILENASCKECERIINTSETRMIHMMFAALRKHAGVRTGGRGRQSRVKCTLIDAEGTERQIFLPMSEHPVLLTMPQFMAPGILAGRTEEQSGLGSLWTKAFRFDPGALSAAERREGLTETIDVLRFSHVLAKIAHSYMVAEVGLANVQSLLTDFVRSEFDDEFVTMAPYMHVGGSPIIEPESDSLHEIGWALVGHEYMIYAVVRIRLFANLGTPTYYVVPGFITNLSIFQGMP